MFPTQELRVRQGFSSSTLERRGFLSFSGQCFGVSHLCWSINLPGNYPGGNAEDNSRVLNPQPWKEGVGRKMEVLVLMGSWEATQTLMGW